MSHSTEVQNKKILRQHMMKVHNGKNYVIKFEKLTRYLSQEEVVEQSFKRVSCENCDGTFTSQQNLREHEQEVDNKNSLLKCKVCPKLFRKIVQIKEHMRRA